MSQTDLNFDIEDNVVKSTIETSQRRCINVGKILLDKLTSKPDFVGQVDAITGEEQTFGKMRDRSIRLALWLRTQGIQSDDVIMLCSHNQMDNISVLLAALYVGAAIHPVYDSLNTDGAKHIMSVSRPKMIFTNEKNTETFTDAAKQEGLTLKVVVIGNLPDVDSFSQIIEEQDAREVDSFQCTEITRGDHVAVILSSSGTTGLPKGVAHGHSTLSSLLDEVDVFNIKHKTVLLHSSIAWVIALMFNIKSIYYEAKKIVCPPFNEELFVRTVEKFQVQWVFLLPINIHSLLKSDCFYKYDLSSLKFVMRAGSSMTKEAVDAFVERLPGLFCFNAYGMTECFTISVQSKNTALDSCGQLYKNVKLKVVDLKTGEALCAEQRGEICVKSPTRMFGYYRNPEATRESIEKDGWLHTGDLGYYNKRGEIFLVDRIKAVIKYRNYHVSPTEIEHVVSNHPGVEDVTVISVPHIFDEEHLVALVKRKPESKVTELDLIDLVISKLEDYKQLRGGVIFLDNIPYNLTGKVIRSDLKLMAQRLINEKTIRFQGTRA